MLPHGTNVWLIAPIVGIHDRLYDIVNIQNTNA